jgi:hypothetical protein
MTKEREVALMLAKGFRTAWGMDRETKYIWHDDDKYYVIDWPFLSLKADKVWFILVCFYKTRPGEVHRIADGFKNPVAAATFAQQQLGARCSHERR